MRLVTHSPCGFRLHSYSYMPKEDLFTIRAGATSQQN